MDPTPNSSPGCPYPSSHSPQFKISSSPTPAASDGLNFPHPRSAYSVVTTAADGLPPTSPHNLFTNDSSLRHEFIRSDNEHTPASPSSVWTQGVANFLMDDSPSVSVSEHHHQLMHPPMAGLVGRNIFPYSPSIPCGACISSLSTSPTPLLHAPTSILHEHRSPLSSSHDFTESPPSSAPPVTPASHHQTAYGSPVTETMDGSPLSFHLGSPAHISYYPAFPSSPHQQPNRNPLQEGPRDFAPSSFLHLEVAASSSTNDYPVFPPSAHPYPMRSPLENNTTSHVSFHFGSGGYLAHHRYDHIPMSESRRGTPLPADPRQRHADHVFTQGSPGAPGSPLQTPTVFPFPGNMGGGRRRSDFQRYPEIPASLSGRSTASPSARNEATLLPTFLENKISTSLPAASYTPPLRQFTPSPTPRGLEPQPSTSQSPGDYPIDPPRQRGGADTRTDAPACVDPTMDMRRSQRRRRRRHPYIFYSSLQEGVGPSVQESPDTSTPSPQRAKRRASDLNWNPCGNCSKAHTKCDIEPPNSPELCKKCKTDGLSQCVPALSRKKQSIRSRNRPVSSHETENTLGQSASTYGISAQSIVPSVPRRPNVVSSSHRDGSSLQNLSQNSSDEVPENPVGNDVLQTAHASIGARSPPGRQHYGYLRSPTGDTNSNSPDIIPNLTTGRGTPPCPPCSPACRHHVRF